MRLTDFPLPTTWDRAGLEALGFRGFIRLCGMDMKQVPAEKGIYVVLRPHPDAPYMFLENNHLGAYMLDDLEGRWITGAPVVYIGKAGTPTSQGGLKQRLRPYSRKGRSHSGGRSIWQLHDAEELLVCWIETPGLDPRAVERDYLAAFKQLHKAIPFANIDGR